MHNSDVESVSGVECFTLSNRHQWVEGGESGGVVQRTGSLGLGHTNKNKAPVGPH